MMGNTDRFYIRLVFSLCVFGLLGYPMSTLAEVKTIGTPIVKNYSKVVYNASPQSWMIDIVPDGFAYFANNDGLLEFDGINWDIYRIPSAAVVRSVLVSDDQRIYTGAFNEIGFFQADSSGLLGFHPLNQLLPDHLRDYDEVWRIHKLLQGFQCNA